MLLKEACRNRDGDDIVGGVRSRGNSKAANGIEGREINPGHGSEGELREIERIRNVRLPAEEIDVVIGAEQRSRNKHRQHNRAAVGKPQYVMKQEHQQAYQNQTKDKLLINSSADPGDEVG